MNSYVPRTLLIIAVLFSIAYYFLREPSMPTSPCPKISDYHYPTTSDEVEALFQQARILQKQEKAKPFKEHDHSEIVRLYSLAASQGHWKAMNNLGVLYAVGYFIPQDKKKAKNLFKSMMDMGVPEGYINMAKYASGRERRRYLQKAAEKGHPRSQYIYAISLYKTKQKSNIKIGEQWMQCAFENGYADAAFSLGVDAKSDGNHAQAYGYYKQGAIWGSQMCLLEMAQIYKYGRYGKKKDLKRSQCFYQLNKLLDKDPTRTFPDIDKLCPPSK